MNPRIPIANQGGERTNGMQTKREWEKGGARARVPGNQQYTIVTNYICQSIGIAEEGEKEGEVEHKFLIK